MAASSARQQPLDTEQGTSLAGASAAAITPSAAAIPPPAAIPLPAAATLSCQGNEVRGDSRSCNAVASSRVAATVQGVGSSRQQRSGGDMPNNASNSCDQHHGVARESHVSPQPAGNRPLSSEPRVEPAPAAVPPAPSVVKVQRAGGGAVHASLCTQHQAWCSDHFILTLVRHGQSDGNQRRVCQGHTHGRLTSTGRRQALALGRRLRHLLVRRNRLADEKEVPLSARMATTRQADARLDAAFTEVWCSDLLRVRQTAALVLSEAKLPLSSFPVAVDERLREKHAGQFEGHPRVAIREARAASGVGRAYRPKGGENWDDVRRRADMFLQSLVSHHSGSRRRARVQGRRHVLVFTHGGVIKEFIGRFVYVACVVSVCHRLRFFLIVLRILWVGLHCVSVCIMCVYVWFSVQTTQ